MGNKSRPVIYFSSVNFVTIYYAMNVIGLAAVLFYQLASHFYLSKKCKPSNNWATARHHFHQILFRWKLKKYMEISFDWVATSFNFHPRITTCDNAFSVIGPVFGHFRIFPSRLLVSIAYLLWRVQCVSVQYHSFSVETNILFVWDKKTSTF